MIDVGFYQLARRRADAVLPALVTKALAAGHRLLVRCEDAALLAQIDAALWGFAPESFVPHGIDSELGAARSVTQPVLLSTSAPWSTNIADCLVQLGGDLPDDMAGLARVLYLFDANTVEVARVRWRKVMRRDDLRPAYWREAEDGRFERAG